MSVTASAFVASGRFVPFRTKRRGGFDGGEPVGTLYVDAQVTGDGGGGSATAEIAMASQEFGFPGIWVVTRVDVVDNQDAATVVFLQFQSVNLMVLLRTLLIDVSILTRSYRSPIYDGHYLLCLPLVNRFLLFATT